MEHIVNCKSCGMEVFAESDNRDILCKKCYDNQRLWKENKGLKEKVRHYEMMYHNTGAIFNRMTMNQIVSQKEWLI